MASASVADRKPRPVTRRTPPGREGPVSPMGAPAAGTSAMLPATLRQHGGMPLSCPASIARSVCGSGTPSLSRPHPAWARASGHDGIDVVSQESRSPRPCRPARAGQRASRPSSPTGASGPGDAAMSLTYSMLDHRGYDIMPPAPSTAGTGSACRRSPFCSSGRSRRTRACRSARGRPRRTLGTAPRGRTSPGSAGDASSRRRGSRP